MKIRRLQQVISQRPYINAHYHEFPPPTPETPVPEPEVRNMMVRLLPIAYGSVLDCEKLQGDNACFHESYKCSTNQLDTFDGPLLGMNLYLIESDPTIGLSREQLWNRDAFASHAIDLWGAPQSIGPRSHELARQVLSEFPWARFGDRAVLNFKPFDPVRRRFSVLNFIYELRDLKGTFKRYRSRKHFGAWVAKHSDNQNVSFGSLIKLLGNLFLEFQYGLGQFLNDLTSVLQSLTLIKARYEAELKGRERILTCYLASEDLSDLYADMDVHDRGSKLVTVEGLMSRVTINSSVQVEYRACAKYSIHCPELDGAYGKACFFLDSLGGNLDPSILWNAVPYSFIIDWFFDVAGWLHSYRARLTHVDLTYLAWTHSLKVRSSREVTVESKNWPQHGKDKVLIRHEVHESYARAHHYPLVMPSRQHVIRKREGLDLRKILIGGILARQIHDRGKLPSDQYSKVANYVSHGGHYYSVNNQ